MRKSLSSFLALGSLFGAASLTVVACGSDAEDPAATTATTATSSSSGTGGTGGGGSTTTGTGGDGGSVPETLYRKTIAGDITWNVTFDDTAKAAGATDCAYTRHYDGVEDESAPWLCPSCEVFFRAQVDMTAGKDDCFTQISTGEPAAEEWIGYGDGRFWRAPEGPTTDQGSATVTGTDIATANQVTALDAPVGGMFEFNVVGALTQADGEGDPMAGWAVPKTYTCGWPKSDAPVYTGDYGLAKGKMVPDGWFLDKCGEAVRLHDFKGSYLVIDMSAMDCPPCQSMAGGEEQFVMDMEAQGITVHVITLLAPSLSDVLGETTNANLNTWINKYDLTSPVLADRGWGLAVFGPAIGEANIGYPSWVIVDPNLTALDFASGFGTWDDFQTAILADAQ